ncbi:6-phosphogluconolactonase (cycloisomerase 2 family) [Bradyrhizobium stylosanthis]|uniref:6-phosphogluconolactonase (Cycloisomerase 2 family) n=2 Tax=Bradyrhizobium stylosanthis TaxID=1803665 RepID=A0A560DYF1_9BRAD|nr:6-phosphogluconolactonase (cycloisomerase 2 family) [Bradyrhizobium stylosanthis]
MTPGYSVVRDASSVGTDRAGLTRRVFAQLIAAGAVTAALPAASAQTPGAHKENTMLEGSRSFVYVGARTTKERNARGDGLNAYTMDNATGAWSHVQLLGDLINPSFLAFDRTRRFLYTVHGDLSDITAMAIDPANGKLSVINRQSTEGKNPVHLAIDPGNRFVVVANHITSTLALLPRQDDGSLGAVIDLVKLEGKIGPHRVEQPFAKPHQVEFDPSGAFIVVPDKGLDLVFTYRIDAASGKLVQAAKPVPAREGAGPRHVAFHPGGRLAYVVNELDSTVTAYHFDPATGALAPFQIVSAVPDAFTGNSRAAEIAVSADGRFVYASNRGDDSIATYAVDASSGRLSAVDWTASGGKTPRFFTLNPSGKFLFAANEDSDTAVLFSRNPDTGRIAKTEQTVKVGSPVCILIRPSA